MESIIWLGVALVAGVVVVVAASLLTYMLWEWKCDDELEEATHERELADVERNERRRLQDAAGLFELTNDQLQAIIDAGASSACSSSLKATGGLR